MEALIANVKFLFQDVNKNILLVFIGELPSKSEFLINKSCSNISIIGVPRPDTISNALRDAEISFFDNPHGFTAFFEFVGSTDSKFCILTFLLLLHVNSSS